MYSTRPIIYIHDNITKCMYDRVCDLLINPFDVHLVMNLCMIRYKCVSSLYYNVFIILHFNIEYQYILNEEKYFLALLKKGIFKIIFVR